MEARAILCKSMQVYASIASLCKSVQLASSQSKSPSDDDFSTIMPTYFIMDYSMWWAAQWCCSVLCTVSLLRKVCVCSSGVGWALSLSNSLLSKDWGWLWFRTWEAELRVTQYLLCHWRRRGLPHLTHLFSYGTNIVYWTSALAALCLWLAV